VRGGWKGGVTFLAGYHKKKRKEGKKRIGGTKTEEQSKQRKPGSKPNARLGFAARKHLGLLLGKGYKKNKKKGEGRGGTALMCLKVGGHDFYASCRLDSKTRGRTL